MKRVARLVNLSYAHERGYYGSGIVVAVVDSGIAKHKVFGCVTKENNESRIVVGTDMVNGKKAIYDDNGHGTHVAGIIGGYGLGFVGMAPQCRFVSVKVLDNAGNGKICNVVDGLQWILDNHKRYNIRIVNISVGTPIEKIPDEESLLVKKVEELWDSGLIVLAAAGNNGPGIRSIGAPGISRKIITVGASDDNVAYVSFRRGLVRNYSGRGPTPSCIKKPDIVAPGSGVLSSTNTHGLGQFSVKSGTSMSTPVVSGAIALLLSRYPDMNNRDVKIRLKNTTVDLGLPHDKQGWGMLDVRRLIEA